MVHSFHSIFTNMPPFYVQNYPSIAILYFTKSNLFRVSFHTKTFIRFDEKIYKYIPYTCKSYPGYFQKIFESSKRKHTLKKKKSSSRIICWVGIFSALCLFKPQCQMHNKGESRRNRGQNNLFPQIRYCISLRKRCPLHQRSHFYQILPLTNSSSQFSF